MMKSIVKGMVKLRSPFPFLLFLWVFVALMILPLVSQGYFLRTRTLLTKMASLGGKGAYEMQQRIHFYYKGQKVELEERWWWDGKGSLRVHGFWLPQMGKKIFLVDFLYRGDRRKMKYGQSKTPSLKEDPISFYFVDRLWFLAYPQGLLSLLAQWGVLPNHQNLLKSPQAHRGAGKQLSWNYPKEPFVSLQMKDEGKDKVVYYLLCASSTKCRKGKLASSVSALWVDQDRFFMKELQLAQGLRLEGHSFQKWKRNLYFPRERKWITSKHQIHGRVSWVRPLKEKDQKKWFEAETLKTSPLFYSHMKQKIGSPYKLVLSFYKKMR